MKLFSRIADIVDANINSILDQAEDPEKLVTLIAHEMEESLVQVRANTADFIAEKKSIRKRIDWLESEADSWQERAEYALSKGREDLAKSALREKEIVAEAAVALQRDLSHIDNNLTRLQSDTQQLQQKLKETRLRQDALIMRSRTTSSRLRVKRQLHDANIDDALVRFDDFESKLDNLEGQVESYDLAQQTLAEEIEALDQDPYLDKELAALKAKIRKSNDPRNRS